MKKLIIIMVVLAVLLGCASIPTNPAEDYNIPPFPSEFQATLEKAQEMWGDPIIFDEFPVVIFRWEVEGKWYNLMAALDPETGVWVISAYVTLPALAREMQGIL